jgi:glycosyltransferase involved in cell wall biosynthesis
MRIVMIGPFGLAPKRTMSSRALPMAQALARRGHQVAMLLPPWSNPAEANTTRAVAGVTVTHVGLPLRFPIFFHVLLTLTLLRRALAEQPDVIHCFKPKAYAGLVAECVWQLKRLRMTRARLVVDADDWEGSGGWNEVEPYSWAMKKFFAWQERWGLTHADAITVASRALQTLVWSLGVARASVFYIPNGVGPQLPSFQLPTPSAPTQLPTLLLYTRFFEFSVARVARLLVTLAAQQPTLQFVIVGNGLFGEEKQFARLLTEAGLSARVTFVGWPVADLLGIFRRATVAIYPFDDTLLNRAKCAVKLTELLRAGVPVVAEAVGQNAEYIAHGESGLLVRAGDEPAFVQAVARVLNDAALRERLGAGAQARMQTYFRWDKLAQDVERAYAFTD